MGWHGPRRECGCCPEISCSECAESELGAMIWPHAGIKITIEISGLASFYSHEVKGSDLDFCGSGDVTVEVEDLDKLNGTYVFEQPAIISQPCFFGRDSTVQDSDTEVVRISQIPPSGFQFCNCVRDHDVVVRVPPGFGSYVSGLIQTGTTNVSGSCFAGPSLLRLTKRTGTAINFGQVTRCDHSTRIEQNLWRTTLTGEVGIATSSMTDAEAKAGEYTIVESLEVYYG